MMGFCRRLSINSEYVRSISHLAKYFSPHSFSYPLSGYVEPSLQWKAPPIPAPAFPPQALHVPLPSQGFPGGSAVLGAGVQSLGPEDPLEKEMATHSSILAWKIPWTEEPGGLQDGRGRHD